MLLVETNVFVYITMFVSILTYITYIDILK